MIDAKERYGYRHYTCRRHGGFWTDGAPVCERCGEPEPKPEKKPTCTWCGDLFAANETPLKDGRGDLWHAVCGDDAPETLGTATVEWRQVHESTTAELLDRRQVLRFRGGLPIPLLRELHLIESELYCRENSLLSVPGTTYAGALQCA